MISLVFFLALASPPLPDTASYQATLKQFVTDDGRVRYTDLHNRLAGLTQFVESLAQVSPDSNPALFPSKQAKLAYWINAYNALVLHAFASEYPHNKNRLQSKTGQFSFFYRRKFKIGGVERSLDDIESKSIRPLDNRIHFSIVCASASCPWLSSEAFTAEKVNQQLDARARLFLNQDRNVKFDPAKNTLYLSKIFSWFKNDFGGKDIATLKFIANYRPEDASRLLKPGLKIQFLEYDWSLNEMLP